MFKAMNSNTKFRSSRPKVFCEKGVLRNFLTFTGKYLYQSLFFYEVASLTQVLSCEFWEISKNTFFYRVPPVAASTYECTEFKIMEWRQHIQ